MHRKELKHMHEQKEEGKKSEMMMMLWEKLGDSEKKVIMMRKLDSKILKKEHMIKQLQYKVETLKTIKLLIPGLEIDANFLRRFTNVRHRGISGVLRRKLYR